MTLQKIRAGKGHYYKLDGSKSDGVTTLINEGLPKPPLVPWAANTTAEYAADHWEELSKLSISARIKELKGARFADRDAAAKRGTEVHKLAESLIAGEAVEVPDALAGHVDSYVRFLDEWQPRAVLIETSVASRRWRYCGTLDAVIDLPDGRRFIVDVKTARSGIWPETVLQLAAYRYAEFYLAHGEEQPLSALNITGALGIWVRSDGYSVYELPADEKAHDAFLHVATVARWAKRSRELIGPEIAPAEVSA